MHEVAKSCVTKTKSHKHDRTVHKYNYFYEFFTLCHAMSSEPSKVNAAFYVVIFFLIKNKNSEQIQ